MKSSFGSYKALDKGTVTVNNDLSLHFKAEVTFDEEDLDNIYNLESFVFIHNGTEYDFSIIEYPGAKDDMRANFYAVINSIVFRN